MSSKQEERLRCVTQHCCSVGRQPRFQDEAPRTFNRPLVNWPEASTLTKLKELIHLTAWMSGSRLETQFGSKLESDAMVIKWERWRCCGQGLVNGGCKGLQTPARLSDRSPRSGCCSNAWGPHADESAPVRGKWAASRLLLPKPLWHLLCVSSFS